MKQVDLPDFEDLTGMIDKIGELSLKKEKLELDISLREADVFRVCMTDELFFMNGKPPAVSYVEATYKRTGLQGDIIPLRVELAEVTARLEVARKSYELMKIKIDTWRSQQATERSLS